jgi:4'-phosphopantetheinyl transferase
VDASGDRAARLVSLASEVHVWTVEPAQLRDPQVAERCRDVLAADERERLARLRRSRDRDVFLVSHALVRRSLSLYACTAAEDWCFQSGEHGRPEIANPGGLSLRFNLSHTAGLAACVVTDGWACGVDVECFERHGNPLAVAQRVATEAELEEMAVLPEAARRDRFLVLWTLKEAYVKARGGGLSLPLRHYGFDVSERICLRVAAPGGDDGDRWQFASMRPTPRHALAVAVRRGDGPERAIVIREADLRSD